MKKKISLILILIILTFITQIDKTNSLSEKNINTTNLTSENFLNFVKEEALTNKITKICAKDYCDYLRGSNIESSLEIFKNKYEEFLSEKTDETIAHKTILKGFPITKINIID